MNYTYFVVLIFNLPIIVFGQYKVTFIVTDNAMYKADKIYAAGTFNNWVPNNATFLFSKNTANQHSLLCNLNKAVYQFKFTKGSWATVEDSTNGTEKSNRIVEIFSDTTIYFTTLGWRNLPTVKPHTASPNVKVLTDSFYIPQLKRYRRVWVYLPQHYYKTKTKYPVLYMQDGQNLFDENTAPFGEWGVDEALDSLQKQTGKYAIVVGINHGDEKRMTEYNPYNTKQYGKGEGIAYTYFLVNTLKPFIDKTYRTKPQAKYTAIAGSSLGALISTYAIVMHPNVYGTAGLFSPAYWIAPQLDQDIKIASNNKQKRRLWFYGGGKEGYTLIPDLLATKANLAKYKFNKTDFIIDENGLHNEATWRKWFITFYKYWCQF